MSKTKVFALVATLAVVALLILPTVALAQPQACRFYGSVTVDGQPVADGTVVKAMIGGAEAASVTTTSSQYDMIINGVGKNYAGQQVDLYVGANLGGSSTFTAGGRQKLDVTVLTEAIPEAGIDLAKGTIAVSGKGMTPNSAITLTWDGQTVTTIPATVKADVRGEFTAMVVAPTSAAGNYIIKAADATGREATVTLNAPNGLGGTGMPGPKGDKGDQGDPGEAGPPGEDGAQGEQGPKGDDASSALGIVALIIAIIAICVAVLTMLRMSKAKPAAPPPPPPAAK